MEVCFHVQSSGNGPPRVWVPNPYKWDFMEYLAFQRVSVMYTHCDEHFIVSFLSLDHAGVQRLLDRWAAGAAHAQSVALCGT
jgi:hypothetical protein